MKKSLIIAVIFSFLFSSVVYSQEGYEQINQNAGQNAGSLYDQVLEGNSRQAPFAEPQGNNSGYRQPVNPRLPYDEASQNIYDPQVRRPLRGKVVVAPAGARFEAALSTTLSSEINSVGDIVSATVSAPLVIGSDVVIPAGSQVVGQVVNAVPAKRFMAGAGGILEIRFTSVQTPDGSRYPISASIDQSVFKLDAETKGSRVAKGVGKAAVGAGLGAALGTALGAIAGGKEGVGKGAWSGAAIGGGLGTLGALAGKGGELILQSGTPLPIRLDQALQAVVPHPGN